MTDLFPSPLHYKLLYFHSQPHTHQVTSQSPYIEAALPPLAWQASGLSENWRDVLFLISVPHMDQYFVRRQSVLNITTYTPGEALATANLNIKDSMIHRSVPTMASLMHVNERSILTCGLEIPTYLVANLFPAGERVQALLSFFYSLQRSAEGGATPPPKPPVHPQPHQ